MRLMPVEVCVSLAPHHIKPNKTIFSVNELEKKLKNRRAELRTVMLGEKAVILSLGHVYTSYGSVKTTKKVLELVQAKNQADAKKLKASDN